MKFRIIIGKAALILFAVFATNLQAQGWKIGGGPQLVSFGDDLEDVDGGFGGVFSAAYRQSDLFALDFQVGASAHDEDLADETAGYAYGMAGARFTFASGAFRPYAVAGISINSVAFDEFDTISGQGIYWGLGAEVVVAPSHLVNISYRMSDWDGEDDVFDYDVSNTYFSVAYNFSFED